MKAGIKARIYGSAVLCRYLKLCGVSRRASIVHAVESGDGRGLFCEVLLAVSLEHLKVTVEHSS